MNCRLARKVFTNAVAGRHVRGSTVARSANRVFRGTTDGAIKAWHGTLGAVQNNWY